VKGPDDMPAPARAAHQHSGCAHWCFCFVAEREDCESCRRKAANQRMLEDYESRLAENQSVGV
jgi:hypothetical protein